MCFCFDWQLLRYASCGCSCSRSSYHHLDPIQIRILTQTCFIALLYAIDQIIGSDEDGHVTLPLGFIDWLPHMFCAMTRTKISSSIWSMFLIQKYSAGTYFLFTIHSISKYHLWIFSIDSNFCLLYIYVFFYLFFLTRVYNKHFCCGHG